MAVTCCHDTHARLWWAAAGKLVGPPLPHGDHVLTAAFHADGRALLVGCWNGVALLWPLPAPVGTGASQVRLWAEVATGMELDESGVVRHLSLHEWQRRRDRLDNLRDTPPSR